MPSLELENIAEDKKWHAMSESEVAQFLQTDIETGLRENEAKQRSVKFGPNEIKGKHGKSAFIRFLQEFNQPLIYILLIAGFVTLLLKDWVDAGVIIAVTFINAIIGFIQESKAENAIAALAKIVTTEATVIRDSQKVRLPSAELVPGDIVVLASGDKVPADLRLISARDLQINEAGLTGESLPVEKSLKQIDKEALLADRTNMAYAGSLVTFGQGKGIVVATGNKTETGRISKLIDESHSLETPLTRKFQKFSKTILYFILGFSLLTFLFGLLKGVGWVEGFKAAVAIAISAIPEGLPTVVTVTLAIGVSKMARNSAIIRKLPAVEALGSTTVICSDKTGTLTENQMTVQSIYAGDKFFNVTGAGYSSAGGIFDDRDKNTNVETDKVPPLYECLMAGLLCNDSHLQKKDNQISVAGDPTEGALIVAAAKAGLELSSLEKDYPRIDTIPFESEWQYMATLNGKKQNASNRNVIYIKGSTEALLKRANKILDSKNNVQNLDKSKIEHVANEMAKRGLRVLAFAKKEVAADLTDIDHKDIESDIIFLGLQGMIDPPRPEAIEAIKNCKSAGIKVKMITGDHPATATAIASQMELSEDNTNVITGQQLQKMDIQELSTAVENTNVFARVAPEEKLKLVEALQAKGHIVAMTGDGVNDAPALKQADIGVAMGITGTEVAKEAADMILTDDNFASIESAVEEGRTVYQNLLKAISFILPVNGGESLTIVIGMLFAAVIPILPVQILWVNMVSSVALTLPLAFEPKSKRVMQIPPRNPDEPLLSYSLLLRVLFISLYNLIAVFGIFEFILQTQGNRVLAGTMAVHTLVAAETFYLLSKSRFIPSIFARLRNSSERVAYVPAIGIAAVLILQLIFSQIPIMTRLFHTEALSLKEALICIGAGFPVIIPALLLKRFAPLE